MTSNNNEKEQFRQMFMTHYARLVRVAIQFMGDKDEAADIVADVMEKAWLRFAGIKADERGAWLYMSVRNACLNRIKHMRVISTHTERLAEATRVDSEADWHERERMMKAVETVACSLDEPARSIIRMCYYEHNTHRQAAERLGISHETVKKHVRKALDMIRKNIKLNEEW